MPQELIGRRISLSPDGWYFEQSPDRMLLPHEVRQVADFMESIS